MAKYTKSVITDAGVILSRKAMDSEIGLEFTRIQSGDGIAAQDEDLRKRTALKNPQQSFALASKVSEDHFLHLKGIISNVNQDGSTLKTGYTIREVGLFAKAKGGDEVLYAICISSDENADIIPKYDSLQPATVTIDFYLGISNTDKISITSNPSAYAAATDVQRLIDKVSVLEADSSEHEKGIQKNETNLSLSNTNWSITLHSDGWTNTFPYTQTIHLPGMRQSYKPQWGLRNTGETDSEIKAQQKAGGLCYKVVTDQGKVTVFARKIPASTLILEGKGV